MSKWACWYHPRVFGLLPYVIIDLREASDRQLVSIWILVLYRLSGRVGFSELQNEPTRKSGFFSLGAQRRVRSNYQFGVRDRLRCARERLV